MTLHPRAHLNIMQEQFLCTRHKHVVDHIHSAQRRKGCEHCLTLRMCKSNLLTSFEPVCMLFCLFSSFLDLQFETVHHASLKNISDFPPLAFISGFQSKLFGLAWVSFHLYLVIRSGGFELAHAAGPTCSES